MCTSFRYLVTSLGKERIILGLPWLRRVNAQLDFKQGTLAIDPTKVNLSPAEQFRLKKLPKVNHFTRRRSEPPRVTPTEDTHARHTTVRNSISTEDPDNENSEQDLLLAYLNQEPLNATPIEPSIEWHGDKRKRGTPMMQEYAIDHVHLGCSIGRVLMLNHRAKFLPNRNVWINATANPSMKFAQKQHEKETAKTFEELVPREYHRFSNVFDKKKATRFPPSRPYDHAIDLKPDSNIPKQPLYSLSPRERVVVDEFVKDNLAKGYIRQSKSQTAAPFFFVEKKDGSLRPCQDYRKLNEATVKNAYPLPLIGDLVDKLQGASIFTKLDLRNGYNNVRIKKGDEWKAAFKTHLGLFEPTVMFFGLCNSPATFQAFMNDTFSDMIEEGWVVIYMDDILIFSNNPDEHRHRTERVLERLVQHDLYLKPEKCSFNTTEVEYLGMIVRPNELAMDPVKIQGILEWPTPTCVKDVRSFLGFGNFYRRFIDHYADLALPLNDLTKKNQEWKWTNACELAFNLMKQWFTSSPVLMIPDTTKPFVIESDASKWASGAVLRQRDGNGDYHPCAYLSRSFSPTERNYEIYDRELLGIIRSLTEWRHYLKGSPHRITILTDHKNLGYYKDARKLNRRQARWSLFLSQFDYELVHTPGSHMIQSDALSRRADLVPKDDHDNEDRIMLPDHVFAQLLDVDLSSRLKALVEKDRTILDVRNALHGKTLPPFRSALQDWEEREGLLFFKDRCYVPMNEDLRRDLIRIYHEHPACGHGGKFKTLELIKRDYWWPGMHTMVGRFVEGCATCQQNKVITHPSAPAINPIPSLPNARPFQQISMDFITGLPPSNGYDAILVVVDHGLTKGVIYIPCTKDIDAAETALKLYRNVYRHFGIPSKVISDRGSTFTSKVTQELGRILGIDLAWSTAYRPQTNGETERVNQELEVFLRIYCQNNPETWSEHLIEAEFAHNNRHHSARNASPFFLAMGYNPVAIPTAYPELKIPSVQERLLTIQKARDKALAAHELARQVMRDRITSKFKPFTKGQKVWLDGRNLNLPYTNRKLSPKREGPFTITDVLNPLNYRLALPRSWTIHPVFHAAFLTPFQENDTHGPNFLRPPPDLIAGEEEYEVEAITKHKRVGRHGQLRYHIKWKGYGTNESSWEPESNLGNAADVLKAYKTKHRLR